MVATKVDPDALREKLEQGYMAITGSERPGGALTWWARQLGVEPNTVWRWVMDRDSENARNPHQVFLDRIDEIIERET